LIYYTVFLDTDSASEIVFRLSYAHDLQAVAVILIGDSRVCCDIHLFLSVFMTFEKQQLSRENRAILAVALRYAKTWIAPEKERCCRLLDLC